MYAMARVDGEIHPKEKEALVKILSQEKLVTGRGEILYLGGDVYLAEFEFKLFTDKKIEYKLAFKSFREFFEKNHHLIDEDKRKIAVETAKKMGTAYKGMNQSELKLFRLVEELLLGKSHEVIPK